MTPSQIMENEHQCIENVIKALGRTAAEVQEGRSPDLEMLRAAVEFLRIYADRLHHLKEEALLFPMLQNRGIASQDEENPFGKLNYDHERGRSLVRALEDNIADCDREWPGASDALVGTLNGICTLFVDHEQNEKETLIPIADKILTDADKRELEGKFGWIDQSIGTDVITRLREFSESVSAAPACNA